MNLPFFIFSLLVIYTIAGYPAIIYIMSYFFPKLTKKHSQYPNISVILCVRNEAYNIKNRLTNLLSSDYPLDKMEIIVVSDGSSDNTVDIAKSFSSNCIKIVDLPKPQGKASAINNGVFNSSGEILVFCDARQEFHTDAITNLTSWFVDDQVGAVSGRLSILPNIKSGASAGIISYWNLEVGLRLAESKFKSVVGVTGAIYAIRKILFEPLPLGAILDDVLIPMRIVLKNKRVLYDRHAVAIDRKSIQNDRELKRKARTLYGILQLISIEPRLMNPFSNPIWFQFISHKVLRLFLPFLLLGCLLFSLLGDITLFIIGIIQLLALIISYISLHYDLNRFPFNLLAGFLLLNNATLLAWFYYISPKRMTWN